MLDFVARKRNGDLLFIESAFDFTEQLHLPRNHIGALHPDPNKGVLAEITKCRYERDDVDTNSVSVRSRNNFVAASPSSFVRSKAT